MSATGYPSYEAWFATLSSAQKTQADELIAMFRTLGCGDPEGWARSEVSENIAQLTRFLFLHRIWSDNIDSWAREPLQWIAGLIKESDRDPNGHFADAGLALRRMTERGVTASDIASVARMIAYETAFAIVHRIDEGHDPDASRGTPGWVLMETDAGERMTGRDVGGLHEDLLSLDPSGREGRAE